MHLRYKALQPLLEAKALADDLLACLFLLRRVSSKRTDPIGSWKRAGARAGEHTHLERGPGHGRGGSSRAALPKACSRRGTVPAAEGEFKREYDPGGIWRRGKVGLERMSPTLAAPQPAVGELRGVRSMG